MLPRKLLYVSLAIAWLTPHVQASEQRPNILFIVADDLGWADTNPYGSTFHETPNINRLAQRGMRFQNFHSSSPVCSPARASLLTGLYAERLGMIQPACHIQRVSLKASLPTAASPQQKVIAPRGTTRLDTRFPNYAKVLGAHGYLTAHYGKWHLGAAPYSPREHGFDVDVPNSPSHGPKGSYFGPQKYSESFSLQAGEHLEDRMADEAIRFIHQHKDRPFLLNYWAFSVHSPWFAKEALLQKYRAKAQTLPADAAQRNPIYAGMVETFDTNVGRLLDALEAAGIADNTIVILTSDNGGTVHSGYKAAAYWGNGTKEEILYTPITSNAPLKGSKGTIYDGGTACPLFVVWPGVVSPGSYSDGFFSGVDIFPTVVEMAGIAMPKDIQIDGVSQVPLLQKGLSQRDTLHGFWPNYLNKDWNKSIPAAWIRVGAYKLTRFFHDGPHGAHRHTLHNVIRDVGESNDLAAQFPEKVQTLAQKLDQHFDHTQATIPVLNPSYNAHAKASGE
ncbi:MAG: sulfatase [Opitutales bacterium]